MLRIGNILVLVLVQKCSSEYGWLPFGKYLYHAASRDPPMDWHSAKALCKQKGGFITEPKTAEQNAFLKAQVHFLYFRFMMLVYNDCLAWKFRWS